MHVHRIVMYWLYGVKLKDSVFLVMHTCDNRKCFEPEHLRLGTDHENMRDASEKGRLKRVPKKFCKMGHELNEENTQISDGHRRCRICINERQRLNRFIKD